MWDFGKTSFRHVENILRGNARNWHYAGVMMIQSGRKLTAASCGYWTDAVCCFGTTITHKQNTPPHDHGLSLKVLELTYLIKPGICAVLVRQTQM